MSMMGECLARRKSSQLAWWCPMPIGWKVFREWARSISFTLGKGPTSGKLPLLQIRLNGTAIPVGSIQQSMLMTFSSWGASLKRSLKGFGRLQLKEKWNFTFGYCCKIGCGLPTDWVFETGLTTRTWIKSLNLLLISLFCVPSLRSFGARLIFAATVGSIKVWQGKICRGKKSVRLTKEKTASVYIAWHLWKERYKCIFEGQSAESVLSLARDDFGAADL